MKKKTERKSCFSQVGGRFFKKTLARREKIETSMISKTGGDYLWVLGKMGLGKYFLVFTSNLQLIYFSKYYFAQPCQEARRVFA